MGKSLIVHILADAKQFGAELDRAAGKTRQMGKVAGVAGLAIAGGLAVGLEKSVKAAEAAQVSTAKMDTAFKTAGLNSADFAKQIGKAEDSSRQLGFSNIDVRDSLGSLVVATHSGSAAIKDLSIAEDIARFKHIGLADASKMLTMAMAGSQRATKALGLTVQSITTAEDKVKARFKDHTTAAYAAALATAKLTDKAATSAQVIGLVSDKLHGQAKAYADTAAGGMEQFHAQTEALQENLGQALLPAIVAITDKLAALTGWLAKHTTVAKILVGVIATLAAGLLALSAATWAVNVAMDANPIGLVIVAVAALAVGIVLLVTHFKQVKEWIVSHWPEVAAVMLLPIAPLIAAGLAVYAFRDKVKAALMEVVGFLKGVFASAWNSSRGVVMHIWDGIKAAWNATVGAEINFIIGLLKDLIKIAEQAASVIKAIGDAAGKVSSAAGKIGHGISGAASSVAHGVGGIFHGDISPASSGPTVTVQVGPVYGTVDADFTRRLGTQLATQLRHGAVPHLQQAIHAL